MAQFLVTHRGTIDGVADEFAHTMVVSSSATAAAVAQTCSETWEDVVWTDIVSLFAGTVEYTGVSAAQILSLAGPELAAAEHSNYASPLLATGDGGMPAQVAMAVSLTAGTRPNGQPLKGRFYLPTIAPIAFGSDGLFNNSQASAVASTMADYFNALGVAGVDVGVWSRTLALFQPVTQVRVGRTPDTIRSRRNALPEEYAVAGNLA